MKKFMRANKKQIAFVVVCLIFASFSFQIFTGIFSIPYDGKQTISLQLYMIPKYTMLVNFTLEIPRVNISSSEVQTQFYNITKRLHSGLNQVVTINFQISFNESEPFSLSIEELEPIKGWSPQYIIYYNIYHNATTQWIIYTYFSTFIAIYSVKGEWLFGKSEIAVFRDAYYFYGSNEPLHFSTERVSQLMSGVSFFLSVGILGILLALWKPWRRVVLCYYPWLTIIVAETMIIMFVFVGTPADIMTNLLQVLFPLISYFPHFDSEHLIGNMKLGLIMMSLLESWIGLELKKGIEIHVKIVVFLFFLPMMFWLIGMAGSGASYVNEAVGTLLLFYIILFRRDLTATKLRLFMFPFLSFFAGYALFGYVIDWFVTGYIYGTDVIKATLHIYAFAIGFFCSVLSFYMPLAVAKMLRYAKEILRQMKDVECD